MSKKIKVDESLSVEIEKVLSDRFKCVLQERIAAFKNAESEGKNLDDCLIAALAISKADEESWIDCFDKISNNPSVQVLLEKTVYSAIHRTRTNPKIIKTKTKSIFRKCWQSLKAKFGKVSEQSNSTKGDDKK